MRVRMWCTVKCHVYCLADDRQQTLASPLMRSIFACKTKLRASLLYRIQVSREYSLQLKADMHSKVIIHV